jgi:uncharacterized phage protein gp47/JayE
MPFTRPTLPELVDRTQQDFVSRLSLAGAVLRRSMVYVLSRVLAGAAHMLHGHLDWLSRQLFAATAERLYLLRFASLFGIAPTAADYAEGTVLFTGSDGSVIPTGTVLLRSDGAQYVTDSEATVSSGEATASVTAVLAGADGTLLADLVLSFESPVAGVDSTATVTASTKDGRDEEGTESVRTRFVERLQSPPHGGADTDYIAWAKEVPGVTRVWVGAGELGAGTVLVRFVRDGDADIIPSAGEVDDVQTHLDEVRPVTAAVTALAPVETPLALTLEVTPDTSDVRAAVEAELTDLMEQTAAPGATLQLWTIRQAIGDAAGLTSYTLTSPSADVTHTAGQLATLGVITWM